MLTKYKINKCFQAAAIIVFVAVVFLFHAPSVTASTITFNGYDTVTFTGLNNHVGLNYYKISQVSPELYGYNNPATNSAEIGNYDSSWVKQNAQSTAVERDGYVEINGTGIKAYNSFYNPGNISPYEFDFSTGLATGVFSSNSEMSTSVNGFAAQYAENRMGLYFGVLTGGVYTFNINLLINQEYAWNQASGYPLTEAGWYSGINVELKNDSTGTVYLRSANITSDIISSFPGTEGSLWKGGTIDLSFTSPVLAENQFYTLYIGDYMQQYGVTPVPEPSTIFLLGFGLIGLIVFRRSDSSMSLITN